MAIASALQALLQKQERMTRQDLVTLLSLTDPEELQALYDAAYAVKAEKVGRVDYYRGLIEFSNRCIKNCCYCGIRRDNEEVERFDTVRQDILDMAQWTYDAGYGSLTLQSGERQDPEFIDYVEALIRDLKKIGNGGLGLTVCVANRQKKRTAAGLMPGRIAIYCALKRVIPISMLRFIPRMDTIFGRSAVIA